MARKKEIAWGILGTGGIARKFAAALAVCKTGHLLGVGSRTKETAHKFAAEFGETRHYGSYAELLADPTIDAVYISLPNHLHAEWTMRCAEAGKHILCEKPLAVNHAQAVRVIDSVRRHDVFLMEAFMYRCHPQTARLVQLIRSGAIGEVRIIEARFSYNMHGPQDNIRQQNAVAGGSIMDVGCYVMSMARLLAGAATGKEFAEPEQIKGCGVIGEKSRIDEWSTATVKFPGGIIANLVCGLQVAVGRELSIWGSAGHIVVPDPWTPGDARYGGAQGERIVVYRDDTPQAREELVPGGQPIYTLEADAVARHIQDRQAPSPCMTWDDSLGNMRALDAWRKELGLGFDCEGPRDLAR